MVKHCRVVVRAYLNLTPINLYESIDYHQSGFYLPIASRSLGDFEDWVIRACRLSDQEVSVINVMKGEALPSVEMLSGVIITCAHAMVTDQDIWIQVLAYWIPQVLEDNVPLLGICFGHQNPQRAIPENNWSRPHPVSFG